MQADYAINHSRIARRTSTLSPTQRALCSKPKTGACFVEYYPHVGVKRVGFRKELQLSPWILRARTCGPGPPGHSEFRQNVLCCFCVGTPAKRTQNHPIAKLLKHASLLGSVSRSGSV